MYPPTNGSGTGPAPAIAAPKKKAAGLNPDATTNVDAMTPEGPGPIATDKAGGAMPLGASGGGVGPTPDIPAPTGQDVSRAPGVVASDTAATTGAAAAPATAAAPAAPQFDQSWLGGADQWGQSSQRGATVPWQLMLATHSGQMTPEQRAYAEAQVQAGANAANPYAAPPAAAAEQTRTPAAPVGEPAPLPAQSTPEQPTRAGPVITEPAAGPATPATATTTDPQTTAYKSALLKMLDQASTPATLEDPALKAQSDAAAVGLTRGTEAGRAALAERMAQQGGAGVNSGAFNNELAGLFNQQGEQQAGINAGLVGDANKQKVQQLQSALTMMGSDINSEQGRALTKELAQAQLAQGAKEFEMNYGLEGKKLAETIRQFDTSTQAGKDALAQQLEIFKQTQAQQGKQFDVDAALKKMGIESQTSLGQGDLSLRDKLGTGGLNAQILQMLMQNSQFGQGLGADLGKFNATMNKSNLDALLAQLGA